MNILIINAFVYVCWLIYSIRKDRKITLYVLFVFLYTIFAICAIPAVISGIYTEELGNRNFDSIQIEPYIYSFIVFFFLIFPFRHLKRIDIDSYNIWENKKISCFINVWSCFYVFFTVLKMPEMIATLKTGLGEAYYARHMESEVLFSYSGILGDLNTRLTWFLPLTVPIVMFYSFAGYIKGYVKKSKSIFLMTISFLPAFFMSIANGSRGSLFMDMFCLAFYIITFWPKFNKRDRRTIFIFSITSLIIVLFYAIGISLERADIKGANAFDGIIRYFGEPFPNLGTDIWNHVEKHPFGDRLFPNFTNFHLNGFTPYDLTMYWGQSTGVKVWCFKTLFGDMYIEYGTLLGLLIPIFVSLAFNMFVKTKKFTILTIPLIYFYFQICVFSFDGFFYKGSAGMSKMIYLIFIMLFLKLIVNEKRKNGLQYHM